MSAQLTAPLNRRHGAPCCSIGPKYGSSISFRYCFCRRSRIILLAGMWIAGMAPLQSNALTSPPTRVLRSRREFANMSGAWAKCIGMRPLCIHVLLRSPIIPSSCLDRGAQAACHEWHEVKREFLCRPFRALPGALHEPRAHALGCSASPLRGLGFRAAERQDRKAHGVSPGKRCRYSDSPEGASMTNRMSKEGFRA